MYVLWHSSLSQPKRESSASILYELTRNILHYKTSINLFLSSPYMTPPLTFQTWPLLKVLLPFAKSCITPVVNTLWPQTSTTASAIIVYEYPSQSPTASGLGNIRYSSKTIPKYQPVLNVIVLVISVRCVPIVCVLTVSVSATRPVIVHLLCYVVFVRRRAIWGLTALILGFARRFPEQMSRKMSQSSLMKMMVWAIARMVTAKIIYFPPPPL